MSVEPSETNATTPDRNRWQFSLRRMFVATTAVAIVFGLAAWGGWVKSDAVVYLAIAVLAGVFWSAARRALLGACAILGAFSLGWILGAAIFGPPGHGVPPGLLWTPAVPLAASAALMRVFTRANALSLVVSLVLIEVSFVAFIIYHDFGFSTLFQALEPEHRTVVLRVIVGFFPEQRWYIAVPWLLGIVLGEVLARHRKSGERR